MTTRCKSLPVRVHAVACGAFRHIVEARVRPNGGNVVLQMEPEDSTALLDATATGLAALSLAGADGTADRRWRLPGDDRRAFQRNDAISDHDLAWVLIETRTGRWTRRRNRNGRGTTTTNDRNGLPVGRKQPKVVYYDRQRPLRRLAIEARQDWTSTDPRQDAIRLEHPKNSLPARGDSRLLYEPNEDAFTGKHQVRNVHGFIGNRLDRIARVVFGEESTGHTSPLMRRAFELSEWPWSCGESGILGIAADMAWRTAMSADASDPQLLEAIALIDRIDQDVDPQTAGLALEELAAAFPSTQWIVTTAEPVTADGFENLLVQNVTSQNTATGPARNARATIVTSSS